MYRLDRFAPMSAELPLFSTNIRQISVVVNDVTYFSCVFLEIAYVEEKEDPMDTVLELRRRREALIANLAEIDDLIALHEELEKRVSRVLGLAPQPIVAETVQSSVPAQYPVSGQRRSVRGEVRLFESSVTEILSLSDDPVDRHKLLDALNLKGVDVGGKDPMNTLGARLFRMPNVENVRGKGYRLVQVQGESRGNFGNENSEQHYTGDAETADTA